MSEPWKDFQNTDTATATQEPWLDFQSAESKPWEDFASQSPAAPSATEALRPQVNSLAPTFDMGWTGRQPAAPEQPAPGIPRLANINDTLIRNDSGQGPGVISGGAPLERNPMVMAQRDAGLTPFTQEQANEANKGAWEAFNEPMVKISEKLGLNAQTVADATDVVRGAGAGLGAAMTGNDPTKAYLDIAGQKQRTPSLGEDVFAGMQKGVLEATDFFTSPFGVSTLGSGALPKLAQRAIALAFATQMSQSAPEQFQQFLEAKYSGDREGMARTLTGLGLTGAFIGTSAAHGVKGLPKELSVGPRAMAGTVGREVRGQLAKDPFPLERVTEPTERSGIADTVPVAEPPQPGVSAPQPVITAPEPAVPAPQPAPAPKVVPTEPAATSETVDAAIRNLGEAPPKKGGTNVAYEIGDAVSSIDHLESLLVGREKYRKSMEHSAGQYFREAIERATKSGSAQPKEGTLFPGSKERIGEVPDFEAKLDFRKNPEVAKWLIDNAERIWGKDPQSYIADIQKQIPKTPASAVEPGAGNLAETPPATSRIEPSVTQPAPLLRFLPKIGGRGLGDLWTADGVKVNTEPISPEQARKLAAERGGEFIHGAILGSSKDAATISKEMGIPLAPKELQAPPPAAAPSGVPEKTWDELTPEEKADFQAERRKRENEATQKLLARHAVIDDLLARGKISKSDAMSMKAGIKPTPAATGATVKAIKATVYRGQQGDIENVPDGGIHWSSSREYARQYSEDTSRGFAGKLHQSQIEIKRPLDFRTLPKSPSKEQVVSFLEGNGIPLDTPIDFWNPNRKDINTLGKLLNEMSFGKDFSASELTDEIGQIAKSKGFDGIAFFEGNHDKNLSSPESKQLSSFVTFEKPATPAATGAKGEGKPGELNRPKTVTKTTEADGSTRHSISGGTVVENPISAESAGAAIGKMLGRNKKGNVRLIDDPTNPNEGWVNFKAGQQPQIVVNLAYHGNIESVLRTVRHELIHPVIERPGFERFRARMEGLVSDALKGANAFKGYATDAAKLNEASLFIVEKLFREHAQSSTFQRGINQVRLAVKQLFGVELSNREVALHLVNQALKNKAHPAGTRTGEIAPLGAPATVAAKRLSIAGEKPSEAEPTEGGELPSVGAAAAEGSGEFGQGTALKNAIGELERAAHGLPEQYPTQRRVMAGSWLRSEETIKNDPLAGQKLADELKHNPERGMTDDDSALLLRHKVALENAKNQAASDTFTAATPEAKAESQARFDGLSNQLLDLLDAAKFRGSQWGREGRWRQALAFEDYSLETMRRDKKLALGRDLTPQENAHIQKLNERIAGLEKQLAEKQKTATATQRINVMEETVRETAVKARTEAAKEKASGTQRDLPAEKTASIDHLKDRFMEQGDLTGGNQTIKKLMELLYREGFTERIPLENAVHDILKKQVDPTITLEETQDLMSGYGKYSEPSKDPVKVGVREVQGQILQVKKMLDIVRKGFAKPTGFLRQPAGQIQRNLIKAVNELKKKYGVPQDAAKALQSALDTVKTRLRNRILDIQQELATKQKIISKRAPSPQDAETIRLRQELDELQKQREEMFPKEPLTPEEQLARLETSADRQIKVLEDQIRKGEIFPKGRQTSNLNSARLAAAKAKIEALKQERDALRETIQPTPEPEVRQLEQLLNRLRNREADYQDRLARGDFGKRVPKVQPTSPAVLDARARVETAKRDFQKGLALDKMKRRPLGAKIYAGAKEALNLPRSVLSAFDVSAVLRQGGFIGFGHPLRAAKSIVPMFKALASEKHALRVEQEILSRPNAGRYASSKLYLAAFDEFRLSKQEEIMMSRFANMLPGVRQSNRAFMVFLNKLRADSFDSMTRSLEKGGRQLQPHELEAVSNYINVATGRGDLGKAAGAAETLATAFFSPRLIASRFQLIAGEPLYRGSLRTRTLVASEYGRMLGGLAVVYGLGALAGATIEDDPRSTDFGKMKFGNTRLDPMMGLSQNTVLLSRLYSGTQKNAAGKIIPVRGEKVPFGQPNSADLLARFARTKLAPSIGTGVDLLTGKNVVGQPVTPGTAAKNLVTPLSMKDIYDTMKEQGITEGTAFGILSLFGMSLQNYEPKPTKAPGPSFEKKF